MASDDHMPVPDLPSGASEEVLDATPLRTNLQPISIGKVKIAELDDSYMFRVALPGVKNDNNTFSCVVEGDRTVHIKGVKTTGEEIVKLFPRTFVMMSKNLGPPGEFSLKFNLPGPVNNVELRVNFKVGILEGFVPKRKPEIIIID